MNWLHRLLNPHCEHCITQLQEEMICLTCDVLKLELASVKLERDKLLNRLLNPITETIRDEIELKPIPPRMIPWNVRKQMLEAEDREKAKLMRDAPKSTDELEKEVLG